MGGWNLPPGTWEGDPNAPWNQEEPEPQSYVVGFNLAEFLESYKEDCLPAVEILSNLTKQYMGLKIDSVWGLKMFPREFPDVEDLVEDKLTESEGITLDKPYLDEGAWCFTKIEISLRKGRDNKSVDLLECFQIDFHVEAYVKEDEEDGDPT